VKQLQRFKQMAKAGMIALTCARPRGLVPLAPRSHTGPVIGPLSRSLMPSAVPRSVRPPTLLYPGVQDYLWYTAHNTLKVPITVRTIDIASVTSPPGVSHGQSQLRLDHVLRNLGSPGTGLEFSSRADFTH
jgi:hypothetical protein